MKQTLRVSIFLPFLLLSGDPSRSLSVRLAYEPAAVPPAAFPQPYYIVIRLVTYARAGPGEHPTELLMASLCFFPVCQTWSVVEREREREREKDWSRRLRKGRRSTNGSSPVVDVSSNDYDEQRDEEARGCGASEGHLPSQVNWP